MPLTLPYTFSNGTVINPVEVNADFTAVEAKFNGAVAVADLLAKWYRGCIAFGVRNGSGLDLPDNSNTIFWRVWFAASPGGTALTLETGYAYIESLAAGTFNLQIVRNRGGTLTTIVDKLMPAAGTLYYLSIAPADIVSGDILIFQTQPHAAAWTTLRGLSVGLWYKRIVEES